MLKPFRLRLVWPTQPSDAIFLISPLIMATIVRVTIRPAFFMANPAFCFTETEEFHHRCSNFVICQAGNDDFWGDLQKKKKVKTCLDARFVRFSV